MGTCRERNLVGKYACSRRDDARTRIGSRLTLSDAVPISLPAPSRTSNSSSCLGSVAVAYSYSACGPLHERLYDLLSTVVTEQYTGCKHPESRCTHPPVSPTSHNSSSLKQQSHTLLSTCRRTVCQSHESSLLTLGTSVAWRGCRMRRCACLSCSALVTQAPFPSCDGAASLHRNTVTFISRTHQTLWYLAHMHCNRFSSLPRDPACVFGRPENPTGTVSSTDLRSGACMDVRVGGSSNAPPHNRRPRCVSGSRMTGADLVLFFIAEVAMYASQR